MNYTLRNASELEKALKNSESSNYQSMQQDDRGSKQENSSSNYVKQNILPATKSKTSTVNNSTAGLLHNLSGIQSITNTKLDALADRLVQLDSTLQTVIKNQEKQAELLATIARNTIARNSPQPTGSILSTNSKSSQVTIKDYGYTSCIDIVSELIMKLLHVVELQVSARGKRYKSSRDLTLQIMNQAVKAVSNCKFKMGDEIQEPLSMPGTKSSAAIHVAKKIGSTDGFAPTMTAASLRELFQDGECRTLITLMSSVIDRLRVVHYIIPYYEADILCAIEEPYLDKHDEIVCNWNKIQVRSETQEEATIMNAQVQKRIKIVSFISKGVSINAAINAVFKDT